MNWATLFEAEADAAEENGSRGAVAEDLLVEPDNSEENGSRGAVVEPGLSLEVDDSSSAEDVSSGGSSVADSEVGNDAVEVISSIDD